MAGLCVAVCVTDDTICIIFDVPYDGHSTSSHYIPFRYVVRLFCSVVLTFYGELFVWAVTKQSVISAACSHCWRRAFLFLDVVVVVHLFNVVVIRPSPFSIHSVVFINAV